MPRSLACALIVIATAAAAAPNANLAAAKARYDQLDYAAASRELDAALKVAGNDRATLLAIYELQGLIGAIVKKPDAAGQAVRLLLTLDPERKLPGKPAPRVTIAV